MCGEFEGIVKKWSFLSYFGIQLTVLKKSTKFLSQAVDYAVDILIGLTRHR